DGTVTASSGSIDARTVNTAALGLAPPGSAYRIGAYGNGNGDDLGTGGLLLYATDPGELHPFDVIVTGKLSTAGLWVN
ncbi:hypothetical protein GY985_25025, partial [Escherichia coli]|nr:hypothetical protein [Escherichia coli]